MVRRRTYECRDCGEFDVFLKRSEEAPKTKKCPKCGRRATRRIKFPNSYSDMGTKQLSTLLPTNYSHKTRGQFPVVQGNAALRETLKRYNGTYGTDLQV